MLWLAWMLSAVYVAAGAVVAGINRLLHGKIAALAFGMNAFAVSFLRLLHLWEPLIYARATGRIEGWQLQLALTCLSVALFFAYALTLGLVLNGLRALGRRGGPRDPG
jgi:hypothetical protein